MKRALIAVAALVAVGGLVWAGQEMGGGKQEGGKEKEGAGQHEMEKASKEHLALKDGVGTWDYVMKFREGPDKPEQEVKGIQTVTQVGDFWIVFDIKTDNMMGMPWHGHGTVGYDPKKKKYVGTFVESMSSDRMLGEGTMDAAGKVLTMDWDGGHMKMREVSERKDKDTGTMTMTMIGPDGKEMPGFTISYKRKK
jgi:hypothetical protein